MLLTPAYVEKTVERAMHFIILRLQDIKNMFSGYYTKSEVDAKVLQAKLDVSFELDESTGDLYMVTSADNLSATINDNGELLITVDNVPDSSTLIETIDEEKLEEDINNILYGE